MTLEGGIRLENLAITVPNIRGIEQEDYPQDSGTVNYPSLLACRHVWVVLSNASLPRNDLLPCRWMDPWFLIILENVPQKVEKCYKSGSAILRTAFPLFCPFNMPTKPSAAWSMPSVKEVVGFNDPLRIHFLKFS